MDLITAVDKVLTAKEFKDALDTVGDINEYSKEIKSKKKLSWDDLKLFGNADLDKAIKASEANEDLLQKALDADMVWPNYQTQGKFMNWANIAGKKGHDSKEAKAAALAYAKLLAKAEVEMLRDMGKLKIAHDALPSKISAARKGADYANTCANLFSGLAKVGNPAVPGTSFATEMFTLSEDCVRFYGSMNTVHSRLVKFKQKLAKEMKGGQERLDRNGKWLKFALSKSPHPVAILMKNLKKVVPVL